MTGFGTAVLGIAPFDLAFSVLAFSVLAGMPMISGGGHEKRIGSGGRHFAASGNSSPRRRSLITGPPLRRPARRIAT